MESQPASQGHPQSPSPRPLWKASDVHLSGPRPPPPAQLLGGLWPSPGPAEPASSPRKLASAEGYLFSASAQHISAPTPRVFIFWSQNGLCWWG